MFVSVSFLGSKVSCGFPASGTISIIRPQSHVLPPHSAPDMRQPGPSAKTISQSQAQKPLTNLVQGQQQAAKPRMSLTLSQKGQTFLEVKGQENTDSNE